jgi:hypothetical protein
VGLVALDVAPQMLNRVVIPNQLTLPASSAS